MVVSAWNHRGAKDKVYALTIVLGDEELKNTRTKIGLVVGRKRTLIIWLVGSLHPCGDVIEKNKTLKNFHKSVSWGTDCLAMAPLHLEGR